MTHAELEAYCLRKPGAYIDFPFGPDSMIIKLKAPSQEKGRIFAQLFDLRGEHVATFNCERMMGEFWREAYPGAVTRGWHCPPVMQPYFNTVSLDGTVPDEVLLAMADHAYEAVVAKLPKYQREELAPPQKGA